MFSALGVRVTLIERRPRLLEFADQEIVEALSYHLRDARVTMRLNEEVESVEEMPDGTVVANLESKKKVQGDALLYAVGRQGNVDELNLAAVGIEADSRGRIPVDKDFRTKVPNDLCGGRRDRVSVAGFGLDGAGTDCGGAGVRRRHDCCRTRASIRTASTRFRRSALSARPRSS